MNRDEFYRQRDLRTVDYGVAPDPLEAPVGIVVGSDAASTPAGQAAALSLINMAARLHRRLVIVTPDDTLLAPSIAPGTSFADAIEQLVLAIDPYNELVIARCRTSLDLPNASIGLGAVEGTTLAASADRYTATVAPEPAPLGDGPSTMMGGALAACLGAASLLQLALGAKPTPRRVSLWTLADETSRASGPGDRPSPIDIGMVAVIGAGAVSSGLAHWLRLLGIIGPWTFVDGDIAELHNTSRALGLLAADAGWANGLPGGVQANKATATAPLVGAASYPGWYEDWLSTGPPTPDIIIPVANGPGVRAAINERGEPLLIHATTSRAWTAELHRHIAEPDGCITCRLPDTGTPVPACSTSPVMIGTDTVDAALPFLSGSAGLLLLAALQRLGDHRIADTSKNHWQLHLDAAGQRSIASHKWSCAVTCTTRRNLPQRLRRQLPRSARWAHLD